VDVERVPVILLGRGITALGALRSLARQRIPVFTACDDQIVPRSRYYRPAMTRSGRRWHCELGDAGLAILADLPVERAVLIPCADDMALWAASLPQALGQRFLTSGSSPSTLMELQDKRLFATLCQKLSVPHPRCYAVDSLDQLNAIPFEQIEQAFFKPSNSIPFLAQYQAKGLWVGSRQEARELWRQLADRQLSVLVQEYVPGRADQHYFIDGFRDRLGIVRARFARRRTRIHPPDFGNSSYCVNVPIEQVQEAWESLATILDFVNYRGIFSAEFKRDAVDGQYKILEINTRVWVYVEFAARCGVDVCRQAYLDALGQPVPDMDVHRTGAGCANVYFDYRSVRDLPAAERPRWTTVLWQWLTSHKVLLVMDDVAPFLSWVATSVRSRFAKLRRGHA
jgi:predicted ATP-grasp superfamily ATP-dependent carboligase